MGKVQAPAPWKNNGTPVKSRLAVEALFWLRRTGATSREITGVIGGKEQVNLYLGQGLEDQFLEYHKVWKELGEKYDWTITNETSAEIAKAAWAVDVYLKTTVPSLFPTVDKRVTAEEAKNLKPEQLDPWYAVFEESRVIGEKLRNLGIWS